MRPFGWLRRKRKGARTLKDLIFRRKGTKYPSIAEAEGLARRGELFEVRDMSMLEEPYKRHAPVSVETVQAKKKQILSGKFPVFVLTERPGIHKYVRLYSPSYMRKVYRRWYSLAEKDPQLLHHRFSSIADLEKVLPRQIAFYQMSASVAHDHGEIIGGQIRSILKKGNPEKQRDLLDSLRWYSNRLFNEKSKFEKQAKNAQECLRALRLLRETEQKVSHAQFDFDYFGADVKQLGFHQTNWTRYKEYGPETQRKILTEMRARVELLSQEIEIYEKYKYRVSTRPIKGLRQQKKEFLEAIMDMASRLPKKGK